MRSFKNLFEGIFDIEDNLKNADNTVHDVMVRQAREKMKNPPPELEGMWYDYERTTPILYESEVNIHRVKSFYEFLAKTWSKAYGKVHVEYINIFKDLSKYIKYVDKICERVDEVYSIELDFDKYNGAPVDLSKLKSKNVKYINLTTWYNGICVPVIFPKCKIDVLKISDRFEDGEDIYKNIGDLKGNTVYIRLLLREITKKQVDRDVILNFIYKNPALQKVLDAVTRNFNICRLIPITNRMPYESFSYIVKKTTRGYELV